MAVALQAPAKAPLPVQTRFQPYLAQPDPGCRFSSKTSCIFTLILQRAKVSKYHQSIKIRFSTQNIKISAVSTPIFASKAAFFSIFQALPENLAENASTFQKPHKSFAPKFENFLKIRKMLMYFDILTILRYISYFMDPLWIHALNLS